MIDRHLDNRHALLAFGCTLVPDAMNIPVPFIYAVGTIYEATWRRPISVQIAAQGGRLHTVAGIGQYMYDISAAPHFPPKRGRRDLDHYVVLLAHERNVTNWSRRGIPAATLSHLYKEGAHQDECVMHIFYCRQALRSKVSCFSSWLGDLYVY